MDGSAASLMAKTFAPTKTSFWILLSAIYVLSFAVHSENVISGGRLCTVLKARKEVHVQMGEGMCLQSYQARCGWFTLKQCTFYEQVHCQKMINVTKTTYVIVTECCAGWVLVENTTCKRDKNAGKIVVIDPDSEATQNQKYNITDSEESENTDDELNKLSPDADDRNSTYNVSEQVDPKILQQIPDEKETVHLSHGAFAGIACAGLFMLCVTIVIVIHVRKRQKKEEKQATEKMQMEQQKMIQGPGNESV